MTDENFIGNFLNGIDAKNRVSIPAGFRDALAARSETRAVILVPHERADCLIGYDSNYLAKVRVQLEARFAGEYSIERDNLFRATFGAAEKAPIDDNGRIIMSASIKDIGDFDGVALFVGASDFFEMWNPLRFVERTDLDPRLIRMAQRLIDARGAS